MVIVLGIIGNHIIYKRTDFYSPMTPYSMMIGFGSATLAGIAIGYFPSTEAVKLNPIDDLSYK